MVGIKLSIIARFIFINSIGQSYVRWLVGFQGKKGPWIPIHLHPELSSALALSPSFSSFGQNKWSFSPSNEIVENEIKMLVPVTISYKLLNFILILWINENKLPTLEKDFVMTGNKIFVCRRFKSRNHMPMENQRMKALYIIAFNSWWCRLQLFEVRDFWFFSNCSFILDFLLEAIKSRWFTWNNVFQDIESSFSGTYEWKKFWSKGVIRCGKFSWNLNFLRMNGTCEIFLFWNERSETVWEKNFLNH